MPKKKARNNPTPDELRERFFVLYVVVTGKEPSEDRVRSSPYGMNTWIAEQLSVTTDSVNNWLNKGIGPSQQVVRALELLEENVRLRYGRPRMEAAAALYAAA
jgi:hypothetical protein